MYPKKNQITAYDSESSEVIGTYYDLWQALDAVRNEHGLYHGVCFRVHENGSHLAELRDGIIRIGTTPPGVLASDIVVGSRSFDHIENQDCRVGSRDKIIALTLKELGFVSK